MIDLNKYYNTPYKKTID